MQSCHLNRRFREKLTLLSLINYPDRRSETCFGPVRGPVSFTTVRPFCPDFRFKYLMLAYKIFKIFD